MTNKPLTKPASQPVTLELIKKHVAIDHGDEDDLLAQNIKAARVLCEEYTGRAFGVRQYRLRLDNWPSDRFIRFPFSPVASVDSITYAASEGGTVALDAANWRGSLDTEPAYIRLVTGFGYPWLDTEEPNPVTVTYTAGTAAEDIPETVAQAIMLIIEYWRQFPGGEPTAGQLSPGMPGGAERLLDTLWTGEL